MAKDELFIGLLGISYLFSETQLSSFVCEYGREEPEQR